VDDAGCRRHHPEVVEGLPSPFQELVALPVPLELALTVDQECHRRAELVHLNGVIDHQIGRHQRIDFHRRRLVTGHPDHRRAHGGQVDNGRNTCEVLQHDPARLECDFGRLHPGGVIGGEGGDVVVPDHHAVVVAEHCFEQDLYRVWHSVDVTHLAERIQPVDRSLAKGGLDAAAC